MSLATLVFYFGFALQLMGFTFVGLCLYSGVTAGDYGKIELAQLVGGSFFFYFGTVLKSRS